MTQTRGRGARQLRAEHLRTDPAFHEYWERTALARAVALRLIGYRIEHQITQRHLASTLGVTLGVVARLEAGERTPSIAMLLRLSAVLGIEFLVHIAPTDRPARWAAAQGEAGTVLETVHSAAASREARVAAI
jgi:transcriptional regulator with XRE-family HTH domain